MPRQARRDTRAARRRNRILFAHRQVRARRTRFVCHAPGCGFIATCRAECIRHRFYSHLRTLPLPSSVVGSIFPISSWCANLSGLGTRTLNSVCCMESTVHDRSWWWLGRLALLSSRLSTRGLQRRIHIRLYVLAGCE